MISKFRLSKYLISITSIIWITGCTLRPNLLDAHIKNIDKLDIVEVKISTADAKKIKSREIYFSIIVMDCNNYANRFPIEPYIAGRRASGFDFPIAGEFVTARGVPARGLTDYPKPCVALQGGSYIFGKLESTPVPLPRLAGQDRL